MRTPLPFIGIALAMATGVLLSNDNHFSTVLLVVYLIWVGPIYLHTKGKVKILHLMILSLFLALGYGMGWLQESATKNGLFEYRNSNIPYTFVLNQSYGGRNFERFKAYHVGSTCEIFIYIPPEISETLFIGDTLHLQNVSPIAPPSNPKEFNFQKWAKLQGVHFQSWIKRKEDFIHIPATRINLKRLLHQSEKKISKQLHQIYRSKKSHGLLYGILLGEKSEVREDTEDLFSSSGTLHTMAVSGLHVGIIAMFLTWVMGPWQIPWYKYLKTFVILVGVWLFVFITGGKPSAIRAGTMFTLFYLGFNFQKRPSSYNILGLSICLFIASNPRIIYDIGFQFSVTAVTSILIFFTPFLNVFKRMGFPQPLRQALALNFSVQVLIAPISIYYFHQFPTYFFITNMIAIPLATVIVILGICSLLVSLLSIEIGVIICQVIHAMENLGSFLLVCIMQWPNSLTMDLWIGKLTLIGFMTAGLIVGIGIQIKENQIIRHGGIVLLLSVISICHESYFKKSPAVIAYAGKNKGLVEIYTLDTLFVWGKADDEIIPTFRSYKRNRRQHLKQLSKHDLPISISTLDFTAQLSLEESKKPHSAHLKVNNHSKSLDRFTYKLRDIKSAICLHYKSPFE